MCQCICQPDRQAPLPCVSASVRLTDRRPYRALNGRSGGDGGKAGAGAHFRFIGRGGGWPVEGVPWGKPGTGAGCGGGGGPSMGQPPPRARPSDEREPGTDAGCYSRAPRRALAHGRPPATATAAGAGAKARKG
jgi:hypothetical protein